MRSIQKMVSLSPHPDKFFTGFPMPAKDKWNFHHHIHAFIFNLIPGGLECKQNKQTG